ncbi:RNA polymerase sigma-24 factor [Fibrobacteres bacterium R8-0-B4]
MGSRSEDEGDKAENAGVGALFRRYGPMVLRRCRRMLGDGEAAADAMQEVFLKALENKKALSGGQPSSFLWTAATNHCLNVLRDSARRGGKRGGDTLLEKIVCIDDFEARSAVSAVLRKLFSRHPESSRAIAYLHYIDGLTLEETADAVNMSVSGVRKRLTALRETLEKMEGL